MTVPSNKLKFIKEQIKKECKQCNGSGCHKCNKKISRINQYAEANIPVEYWFLIFDDFEGDPNFKKIIADKIENIEQLYSSGKSLALIGKWGVGKTYAASSLLKMAIVSGFTSKFYTMSEVINSVLSKETDTSKFLEEITTTDFVVLDEFDNRWVYPSEKSQQMFGQTMEYVLRARFSNHMPTIICSNTAEIKDVLSGVFTDSFNSLLSKHVDVIYVAGKDFRKTVTK